MNEKPLEVSADEPVENPEQIPANPPLVITVPSRHVKMDPAKSRIGITKKVYRPVAEKKARRLAKKMRAANRRHNSSRRGQ